MDGVNQGLEQLGIEGLQIGALLEDHVRGIFGLPDVPVIGELQVLDNRAILRRPLVQFFVQLLGIELVSQAVRFGIIGDVEKSIVVQGIPNPAASQFGSEPRPPLSIHH